MSIHVFPYEVEYYKTEDGTAPFREWLAAMRDINGRAKIRVRLDRARLGNLGDHKSVDEGVWELRIDYGPGYRVYFGLESNRVILLLIGGDKATQRRDIAKAMSYLQDYRRRRFNGTYDRISERSD